MNKLIDLVLLVDDDEAINFLNRIMVEESGITDNIIVYNHAKDALNKLKVELKNEEIKSIILFLDLNMPLMNGWEFLDSLTECSEIELIKLKSVMVTASVYPKDLEKINNHPMIAAQMPKPLESERIRMFAEELKT